MRAGVGAALAAAMMIAACGSRSPTGSTSATGPISPTGTGSASSDSTLAFSKCMRAHGVPSYPATPPGATRIQSSRGPNGQIISVNGVAVTAPAYRAARQSCAKYLPQSYTTAAQTARFEREGLKFARCMRGHGIKNFPDPKLTIGPGGGQGVNLSGAGLDFQSPAFQTAANACGGFGSLKGS